MRKMLFGVAILCLMLGMAASVSADGFAGFSTICNDDGTYSYEFDCGVRVTLSEDWYIDTFVMADSSEATFFHRDSYRGLDADGFRDGGRLFSVTCSSDKDYEIIPDYRDIGYDEANNLYYYAIFPTDYQAYAGDEKIRARYDELFSEVYDVAASIELADPGDPDDSCPADPESREYEIHIGDGETADLIYECPDHAKSGDVVAVRSMGVLDADLHISVNGDEDYGVFLQYGVYVFVMPSEDVEVNAWAVGNGLA